MAALWGDRIVRILVDNYHDSGGRHQRLGYPASAELTVCRERLTWGLLKRYHVAVIEATAPAQVAVTELRAVERFVSEGGGVLIAGSAPQYEFATGAGSPMDMPAAHFAEVFGFEFLSADSARAETTITSDLTVGYSDEDVQAVAGAIAEFGPHAPGLQPCAPLTLPDGARPLLVHAETGEPLAAVYEHGAGRVCVCAGPLDHLNLLAHLDPIVTWLAGEAEHRPGGRLRPEIGPQQTERTIRGLRLVCDPAVEGRAEAIAALVCRLEGFLSDLLGKHWERPKLLEVRRSCHRQRSWEGGLYIAAAGSEVALAYNTILVLVQSALWSSHADDLLTGLFPEPTVTQAIALLCLEHLGYTEEARRLRERALEAAERADPEHTGADLARVYWATSQWHPKGHWLLAELQRRFGEGFLARLFEVLPKERKDDKLPQSYTTAGDRVAYYLSLAAGEELTPFLREVGTSVRSLPLVPQDDDGFDDAMRAALVAGLTEPDTGAADRMDALSDLARLKDEERAKLPEPARELTEAFMRSAASDQSAVKPLERLARAKDAEAAAWAALQLVSMGRTAWADRLEELLPERDVRFRLMGGHVLQRIGRERPEHTLQGLARHDAQVAELRSVTRDLVAIHPMVGGYEVANVLAEAGLACFPYDHLATQFYVYWVHTLPGWRRAGLSRTAFAAAMEHPEALRCSCFALNTGTRNNAHALYAEFGYVDMDRRERATKQLHAGTPCVPPDGVALRAIADSDRDAVRRLVHEAHADSFTISPLPVPQLGPRSYTAVAERDGKLVGAALARYESGDGAELQDVVIAEAEEGGPQIALALLARLHAMLAEAGAKRATAHVCSDLGLFTGALAQAGYAREVSGGVNMFGIRDLRQLFEEIRPLYERRLRDTPYADWQGRVLITGNRLAAGLECDRGVVSVIGRPTPRGTDIVLRSTDAVITRFVTGRETPLEGYLQQFTHIEPQTSPGVMGLLETLFPQVPFVLRWGW